MCIGHLCHFSAQRDIGVIWCTCLKMACNSKMAGHKKKRILIWDSGVVGICSYGRFDPSFKVSLGPFGALLENGSS